MPRADQATIDLLTDYFDAMQAKDLARLRSYYADNITQTFANARTITGRDAMLEQMTTLLGAVKSLAHPLINVWQEDGGVVIFEVTSQSTLRKVHGACCIGASFNQSPDDPLVAMDDSGFQR